MRFIACTSSQHILVTPVCHAHQHLRRTFRVLYRSATFTDPCGKAVVIGCKERKRAISGVRIREFEGVAWRFRATSLNKMWDTWYDNTIAKVLTGHILEVFKCTTYCQYTYREG